MANVAQIITENLLNKMKETEEQGKTFRWVNRYVHPPFEYLQQEANKLNND